jgi:hypothetical protein
LPYDWKVDINKIKDIENSLRNYANGHTQNGISYADAFEFLDWITYNARSASTNNTPESAMTATFTGKCGPTQRINTIILQKMGLDVKPFNMGDCVGELPMTVKDKQRIENGMSSTNVRHAVAMLKLPIQENGKTQIHTYLLDPTFRQFCLKENCNKSVYSDEQRLQRGYVAPHPAYFLTKEYLKEQGESEEKIKTSNYIAQVLINRGFMELTEENAKIYGDAFARAGIREQFKDIPLKMTGRDYIYEFENDTEKILNFSGLDEEKFTKTPLEITNIKEKKGLFTRIKEIFMKKSKRYFPDNTESYVPRNQIKQNTLKEYKVDNYNYPDYGKIMQTRDNDEPEIEER